MNQEDIDKIKQILAGGYSVEVVNPEGATFAQRYKIYQLLTVRSFAKRNVIFDDNGNIIAFEG